MLVRISEDEWRNIDVYFSVIKILLVIVESSQVLTRLLRHSIHISASFIMIFWEGKPKTEEIEQLLWWCTDARYLTILWLKPIFVVKWIAERHISKNAHSRNWRWKIEKYWRKFALLFSHVMPRSSYSISTNLPKGKTIFYNDGSIRIMLSSSPVSVNVPIYVRVKRSLESTKK